MESDNEKLRQRITELEQREVRNSTTEAALRNVQQELRDANMRLSAALTELKKSQQQLVQYERLVALSQMARGIAHEINNALMPILGFSDLLLNNPDLLDNRQETLDILKDVNAAAVTAADIIRGLREFYRTSDDVQHYSDVKVNALIQSVLEMTEPRWRELEARGCNIKVKKDLRDVPPVNGAESQLRDALMHLLLNSVDAMPQGGAVTFRSELDNNWVKIEVEDTGIGMNEEVRRRCFEPFFTTKGPQATGMGLALAYGTVRRHGGTIEVQSQTGQGARVTIRLPPTPPASEQKESTVTLAVPSLHVLIVDDDPWSCSVTRTYLNTRKHVSDTAESGTLGIEKFRSGQYDLVVVDRAMPDMSGDQVAQALAQIKPGTPVIMVTGFGDVMTDEGERPAGVTLVLGKPITEQQLHEAVATAWARRQDATGSGGKGAA